MKVLTVLVINSLIYQIKMGWFGNVFIIFTMYDMPTKFLTGPLGSD